MDDAIAGLFADGRPEPEELMGLLTRVSSDYRTHFVVIDGWDECAVAQQRAVKDVLGRIAASTRPTFFKVFIACCGMASKELPSTFRSRHIVIASREHVDVDIATFVEETLQMKISQSELLVGSPELVGEIRKALVTGADGMLVSPVLHQYLTWAGGRKEQPIAFFFFPCFSQMMLLMVLNLLVCIGSSGWRSKCKKFVSKRVMPTSAT